MKTKNRIASVLAFAFAIATAIAFIPNNIANAAPSDACATTQAAGTTAAGDGCNLEIEVSVPSAISLGLGVNKVSINATLGSTVEGTTTATVNTNNAIGYDLQLVGSGADISASNNANCDSVVMLCKRAAGDTAVINTGAITFGTVADARWGFRVATASTAGSTGSTYAAVPTTATSILPAASTAPASDEVTNLFFGVNTVGATEAGTYSGQVTVTAVVNV